jgi:hypothetical protein
MVGNAIRMMYRSPKSRAGCHLAAAIGLRSMLEDFAPEIPDYALDMHTMKGKAMGRGLDHFRKEGAKLVPPPTADDPYEDEAYRLWTIKERSKQAKAAGRFADVPVLHFVTRPHALGQSANVRLRASSRLTRSRKPANSNPAPRGWPLSA